MVTEENCKAEIEKRMGELADLFALFLPADIDQRAWSQLLIYASGSAMSKQMTNERPAVTLFDPRTNKKIDVYQDGRLDPPDGHGFSAVNNRIPLLVKDLEQQVDGLKALLRSSAHLAERGKLGTALAADIMIALANHERRHQARPTADRQHPC